MSVSVGVSSVLLMMVSMHIGKPISAQPRLGSFPNVAFWNSCNGLINYGPFLSFQGQSCASSSNASLLQAIDGHCDVLGFGPAGSVSSFSPLWIFGDKLFLMVTLLASLSAQSFPLTPAYPEHARVHPQELSQVDVKHCCMPTWASRSSVPFL